MIKIKNQDELDAFIVYNNARWPGPNAEFDAMHQIKDQLGTDEFRPMCQVQIIAQDLTRLEFHGKPLWNIEMFVVQLELVDD
jgi:hypothetical protein